MIDTAVILAAGMGTRLQNVINSVPKGFIEVGGKTLIEHSIDKLLKQGIQRIIIVTGHLSHFYKELLEKYPDYLIFGHNKDYATSGSMYSLFCAAEQIDQDFLLLESDLIYESRAIKQLLNYTKENAILLSGKTNSGDEVYVETINDKIVSISKKKNKLGKIEGELVGISKISFDMYNNMILIAKDHFKSDLYLDYEDCIVKTAKIYPVYSLKIVDLIWTEVDDELHYKRLLNTIFPKLSQNETI